MSYRALDWRAIPLAGRQLIEASAGTGKTYTITTLVLRLVLERRVRVDELLVVTFTNAATAELRDRVRRRLRSAEIAMEAGLDPDDPQVDALVKSSPDRDADRRRLQEALRSIDEAAIYTIHGFCQRVLQENAFESGVRFELELLADARPLIGELVEDFWSRVTAEASEACVRYLQAKLPIVALHRLARLAAAAPGMPIEPEPRAVDPGAAVERYLEERGRVAEVWARSRTEVSTLLLSTRALSRVKYRTASVRAWIEQLDELLTSQSRSTLGMFKDFDRFTAARLREATNKGHAPPEHPLFDACERLLAAHEEAQGELADWAVSVQHDLVQFIRTELLLRKRKRGVQTFDDLLLELAQALRRPGGAVLAQRIYERHPFALIDEFQDTDPTQYEIFDRIYSDGDGRARGALLMIGDPKQAIYAFRGADVFAYLRAARDTAGTRWTLDTSYRTDPTLLHALNQVFSRPARPFEIDSIEYHPVRAKPGAVDRLRWPASGAQTVGTSPGRPPMSLLFVRKEGRQESRAPVVLKRLASGFVYDAVAREVVSLLESGATIDSRRIGPGDIAILTRKNKEAIALQELLLDLGVPAVLQGDASVFDAPEAADVASVLRALATPTDAAALRCALATTLIGVDANELEGLRRDEVGWESWVERFFSWHELWVHRGFMPSFRALRRDLDLVPRLLAKRGGERRLTNVLHLGELLHDAASSQHLGIAGLLRWFDQVRHDPAAREELAPESQQVRLESDARAVQLTTMHKSKGLEYPVVFCPFLWDGRLRYEQGFATYHDPRDGYRLKLDLAPSAERPESTQQADREALAEALRLTYVAMTRAKHRLVVVCGSIRSYGTSALAHLLHDPSFIPTASAHSPAERVKSADDEALRGDLDLLVEASRRPGQHAAVEVIEPDGGPVPRYRPRVAVPRPIAHRTARRKLHARWRATSFSALTAGPGPVAAPAAEGLDHDEDVSHAPASGSSEDEIAAVRQVVLHSFPRGAAPGNVLHGVLEVIDFTERRVEKWRDVCAQLLERFGLDSDQHADVLRDGICDMLATPLTESGPCLNQIATTHRACEMEFTLPVGWPRAEPDRGRRRALTPRRLAEAFATYASPSVPRDYATRIADLKFDALVGYLRGFIDLVFVHEGRWYVVDYKSNHLGPLPSDYALPRLTEVMADHHYILQYHLYSAALHRHLQLRLPGYDHAQHFGGVFYLFARGMHPTRGPSTGVFADRPTLTMVDAVLTALDGTTAEGEA